LPLINLLLLFNIDLQHSTYRRLCIKEKKNEMIQLLAKNKSRNTDVIEYVIDLIICSFIFIA